MIGIGRGFLLALLIALGLVAGSVGFVALGLKGVAPSPLPPAAAAQEWEVTLELTDDYLTKQVNADGEDSPFPLRDLRVTSRDDGTVLINATVQADPSNLPGRLPFRPPSVSTPAIPGEIILRPGVRDGRIRVEVERANLGPLPFPANLGQILEKPLNRQVTNMMQERPFRIVDTTTRSGAVIVRAVRGASSDPARTSVDRRARCAPQTLDRTPWTGMRQLGTIRLLSDRH